MEAKAAQLGDLTAREPSSPQGVIPVVETPFDEYGDLDLDSVPNLVRYLAGTGVQWLMYPGFASEYYKIDSHERDSALSMVLESCVRHRLKFVAGVTDQATVLAERRALAAVEAGAAAINLLPPHLFGPERHEVDRHVRRVVDAVHPCPVVLQLVPALTGAGMAADWLAALTRDCENLRAVKVENVPPGPLIKVIKAVAPRLSVMVGFGGLHLPDALSRGAAGVQPGCSFTELYQHMWRAWRHDDVSECKRMYYRLLPYLAYWMTSVELIVAVEKEISYRRGIIGSSHCRRPRRSLDAEEQAMIGRFMAEFDRELPIVGEARG